MLVLFFVSGFFFSFFFIRNQDVMLSPSDLVLISEAAGSFTLLYFK